MHGFFQDLSYATRTLAKRRAYAVTTVAVFALAIGANTTVFSIFDALLLRPLPYPGGNRVVVVYSSMPKMGLEDGATSIPNYIDWREQAGSLGSLAMIAPASRTLGGEARPEQISLARASPSLFSVLGIAPALGRAFAEGEATPGKDRVVLLSHRLWRTRFGAQADAIGRHVSLDGESYSVIGVMPEGFNFFNRRIDAWIPFAFTAEEASEAHRGQSIAISIGRLRPGASLEGLNAELGAIERERQEQAPPEVAAFAEATGLTTRAKPLREFQVGDLEQTLLILQGLVLAVLLIACANVTNLQLSRVASRRQELSVRAALGARHARLIRLVLVESLVLAVAGGLVGLALARGGLALVHALGLDRSAQGFEFTLDSTALAFTAATAVLAALVSGLPAVFAPVGRAIYEAGRLRGAGPGRQGFRGTLVVAQLAVSVALLVGAGLLTRSFYALKHEGPGFDASGVWSAAVALPEDRYPTPESRARFFDQALDALGALPGVTSAGLTSSLPFSGQDEGATVTVDGYTPPTAAAPPAARLRSVSSDYFTSLEMTIIEGRGFDRTETDRVAIVDERMVRQFWPGGNAIGQRVRLRPQDPWSTIVGVVPTVKHETLIEEEDWPTIYWHYRQQPPDGAAFTLRTTLAPEQLDGIARAAIARIDPDLALYDASPLAVRVAHSLGPQRTPMVLTLAFGAIALMLAVVGIYGVLTSAVTQRVREIGVRMAIGARTTDVVRMILAQGARLIALGLVLGIGSAVVLGRVMSSQMHYVTGFDPAVLGLTGAGLTAAALVASWLPARRASRIDPMQALREE
jgi:predicted permease